LGANDFQDIQDKDLIRAGLWRVASLYCQVQGVQRQIVSQNALLASQGRRGVPPKKGIPTLVAAVPVSDKIRRPKNGKCGAKRSSGKCGQIITRCQAVSPGGIAVFALYFTIISREFSCLALETEIGEPDFSPHPE
jgi:hypothetical protein